MKYDSNIVNDSQFCVMYLYVVTKTPEKSSQAFLLPNLESEFKQNLILLGVQNKSEKCKYCV